MKSTMYEMRGEIDRPFFAKNKANGLPKKYATPMAIGILSRFTRLKTAPLRNPLKMSRTIVAMKSRSIQFSGPIIYIFPSQHKFISFFYCYAYYLLCIDVEGRIHVT